MSLLLAVRSIIQKVERAENLKQRAWQMSQRVEWQFHHPSGQMVSFDRHTNLLLEEALERQQSVNIKIDGKVYVAHAMARKAVSTNSPQVELLRKDKKG